MNVDITEEVRTRAWEAFTDREGADIGDLEGCIDAAIAAVAPLIVGAAYRALARQLDQRSHAVSQLEARGLEAAAVIVSEMADALEGK
jgi:hypothetical protein